MENIRLGRKDASDQEVMEAARAAQCEEFIHRLPNGYETRIGEMVLPYPAGNGSGCPLPGPFKECPVIPHG